MNTFDLIFYDYQSRHSEKSENDLFMCLRCPVFNLFVKQQEQLLGRCDHVLRDRTRYARGTHALKNKKTPTMVC
jgi:hypothetical protein